LLEKEIKEERLRILELEREKQAWEKIERDSLKE
jgi:hypothetical protein